jgi:hypothetical protein
LLGSSHSARGSVVSRTVAGLRRVVAASRWRARWRWSWAAIRTTARFLCSCRSLTDEGCKV